MSTLTKKCLIVKAYSCQFLTHEGKSDLRWTIMNKVEAWERKEKMCSGKMDKTMVSISEEQTTNSSSVRSNMEYTLHRNLPRVHRMIIT